MIAGVLAACGAGSGGSADADDAVAAADPSPPEPPGEVPADHPWPARARVPFLSLDGDWDFALDPQDAGLTAGWADGNGEAAPFEARVRVPFPPEAEGAFPGGTPMPAGTTRVLWYRLHVQVDGSWASRRVVAVFLGVDGHAMVFANGTRVGEHDGGYAPFEVDLSDALREGDNTLIVRTEEPESTNQAALVGSQPALGNVSGIWRSAYLEARGARWAGPLSLEPYAGVGGLGLRLRVALDGDPAAADGVELALRLPDGTLAGLTRPLPAGPVLRLDWCCSAAPWSPATPDRIDAALRLTRKGDVVDEQRFAFGLREVGTAWCPGGSPDDVVPGVEDSPAPWGCVHLNGAPTYLRALTWEPSDPWHRGACPDGTCDADLRALSALGFNAVRVRGTTLPPRVLAEADRLGVLVLADLPGLAQHATDPRSTGGAEALEAELEALLPASTLHPSVLAWSLFQEEAGLLHPPFWHDSGLTDWLAGLVHRARALVPATLVEDNVAGGFSRVLDGSQPHLVTDVQSYVMPATTLAAAAEWLDELTTEALPGSAWNFVGATPQQGQPILVADASCRAGSQVGGPLAGCLPELLTLLRGQRRLAGYSLAAFHDRPGQPGLFTARGGSKVWGYEAFGLTLAQLLGDDFVQLAAPLVRVVQPSTEVDIPVGLSTGRAGPRPGWSLHAEAFFDTCTLLGKPVREALWTRELPLPSTLAFGPNGVGDLTLTTPDEPGTVTVLVRLVDEAGATAAANRLQAIVPGACQRAPADEAPPDVAIPLGATWNGQWSAGWGPAVGATLSGYGSGYFKWDLYNDLADHLDDVERFALVFEAAPCPPDRPLPQTDADVVPGRGWCRIFPEGTKTRFSMGDAYADARGVLSGANAPELTWSFGDLVRLDIHSSRIGVPWLGVIRVECGVDADSDWGHGLRIFDEASGRWPVRPTLYAWKKR